MKKVLLFNPPGRFPVIRDGYCSHQASLKYYWPQLDLLFQSGILGQSHEIHVLDATALGHRTADTIHRMEEIHPDVIFFVSGEICWSEDSALLDTVKKKTGATMIGSGDILQFYPEEMIQKNMFLDAILHDFTSDAALRFVNGDDGMLENITYRRDKEIISGRRTRQKEPYAIPVPHHEYFPLKSYSLPFFKSREPFTVTLFSYGCPFHCSYCNASDMGFRVRKIDNALDELRYLRSLNVKNIFVRDASFTNNQSYAVELSRGIQTEKMDLNWFCFSRVDTVDEKTLKAMKEAGCFLIFFGLESSDNDILKRHKDGATREEAVEAFRLCKNVGIKVGAYIMLGLPGDAEGKIFNTLKFVKNNRCDYISVNITTGRPGTHLRSGGEFSSVDVQHLGRMRKKLLRSFYLSPGSIMNLLGDICSPRTFFSHLHAGYSILFG